MFICTTATSIVLHRGKSGPALSGTEYRLMPSACRLIVRERLWNLQFRYLVSRAPMRRRNIRTSDVVPPDPSVHFYHWFCKPLKFGEDQSESVHLRLRFAHPGWANNVVTWIQMQWVHKFYILIMLSLCNLLVYISFQGETMQTYWLEGQEGTPLAIKIYLQSSNSDQSTDYTWFQIRPLHCHNISIGQKFAVDKMNKAKTAVSHSGSEAPLGKGPPCPCPGPALLPVTLQLHNFD